MFNPAAVGQIKKSYGSKVGPFNQWLVDGLDGDRFRTKITDHQLQFVLVEDDEDDPAKFDDLKAALANFGYYAMYKGETIADSSFADRIASIKPFARDLLPGGVWKTDAELVKLLEARFKAVVCVDSVGVYAGDIYEFNGWQYLGNWDLEKKTVSGNAAYAADSVLFNTVKYGWRNQIINVENQTFRDYRTATCKGGDFIALTPIKLTPKAKAFGVAQ